MAEWHAGPEQSPPITAEDAQHFRELWYSSRATLDSTTTLMEAYRNRAEAAGAELESEVSLYRSALESIRDNSRDDEAVSIAKDALKGKENDGAQ